MTIYFQHVGEKGGGRDFPKTIGTPRAGLRRFKFADIAQRIDRLSLDERNTIDDRSKIAFPMVFKFGVFPQALRVFSVHCIRAIIYFCWRALGRAALSRTVEKLSLLCQARILSFLGTSGVRYDFLSSFC
jgi:hypothetical protein